MSGEMLVTDLVFRVRGDRLAWDHSYALFGALCRRQPRLHQGRYPVGVFPINGVRDGERGLRLTEKSELRLRMPEAYFGDVFPLIGVVLELDSCRLTLDSPRPTPVPAASRLYSSWVTFSEAVEPESFLQRLEGGLQKLEVQARASLVAPTKPREDERFVRRTRGVKGQQVAGYAVLLEELSPEHSMRVSRVGLGGRRHFGGGLFLPARARS